LEATFLTFKTTLLGLLDVFSFFLKGTHRKFMELVDKVRLLCLDHTQLVGADERADRYRSAAIMLSHEARPTQSPDGGQASTFWKADPFEIDNKKASPNRSRFFVSEKPLKPRLIAYRFSALPCKT
jgi:hypothetical protein